MDHEVPVQSVAGRGRGACARPAQGDLRRAGSPDCAGAVSPDHVHMLVVVPPQLAPAKLVQFLKGRSSRMLQRDFQHLRKGYWGQHLWARGYFCATVGAVDEKTVMAYIESQKWDQDDEGFKVTAPTEP